MKQPDLFQIATTEKPKAEPQTRPHTARFCSDLASPLLKAQQQNDKAQAALAFDAFALPLFKGKA